MVEVSVFWFRRDLRLGDNHALFKSLQAGCPVLPLFIFDSFILNQLEGETDARVSFIYDRIEEIRRELKKYDSDILVFHGAVEDVFSFLLKNYTVKAVYINHDYEPYALKRDLSIQSMLQEKGINFYSFKDQVIFEKNEVVKEDSSPYTVYSPYMKRWKSKLISYKIEVYGSDKLLYALYKFEAKQNPTLEALGFKISQIKVPPFDLSIDVLNEYETKRNIPSLNATSRIGVHLRFGTVSIRKLVSIAVKHSDVFLNELIWREFFMQILFHFPFVVTNCFKRKYDSIEWRNNEDEFNAWCNGETGYPIVDAGMKELNHTGFMHNRVRMICASFLVKDLLIDWRWGEAYFASKLLDYELSSNNGNWQWAAGTGCDAAPYFRIFNPYEQARKFDPNALYIRKWLPEAERSDYIIPIIEHSFARKRALEVYKKVLV